VELRPSGTRLHQAGQSHAYHVARSSDTHASLCAQAGVPIEVVSQRLGHASIGVTVERYLHVYRSRDAEAADAFGRLVG
jgi:integrase